LTFNKTDSVAVKEKRGHSTTEEVDSDGYVEIKIDDIISNEGKEFSQKCESQFKT